MNRKQYLITFLLNAYLFLYGPQDSACDISTSSYCDLIYARLECLSLAELETSYKITRETLGY